MQLSGEFFNSSENLYPNTESFLAGLNFDTSNMVIKDDFSALDKFMVENIDGNGSISLQFLKTHVEIRDTSFITTEDIGRPVKIILSGYDEPFMTTVSSFDMGGMFMWGIFYNYDPATYPPFTGYPIIQFADDDNIGHRSMVVFETELEESTVTMDIIFTDTNEPIIQNFQMSFIQYQPGIGYAYGAELPIFDITTEIDPSFDQTFNFSNITYMSQGGVSFIVFGNLGVLSGDHGNSDLVTFGYYPGSGMVTFISVNVPDIFLLEEQAFYGLNEYFQEFFNNTPGADYLDFFYPLISDLVVNEAYVSSKLDSKYINLPSLVPEASSPIYVNNDEGNRVSLFFGDGLTTKWQYNSYAGEYMNQLVLENASQYTVGGIKIRVSNGACYITTNGQNP